jgi:hypothetical protein
LPALCGKEVNISEVNLGHIYSVEVFASFDVVVFICQATVGVAIVSFAARALDF